ncbi:MAG TPA: cupin domain-containing protein [Rhizomicrobium sp.]
MSEADKIIRLLKLKPHLEGGYFRETFRDPQLSQGRACSTAIYFLLKKSETSRWHRIDAAEVWHWYAGAPLELKIGKAIPKARRFILGNELPKGQQPQIVVPAHHWQSARSLGDYTLVGCTVAPGFLFETFELAPQTNASEKPGPARARWPAKTLGLRSRDRD